jgi:hypothetical protein
LARLLKLFGIHPTSVRIQGKGTPKRYMRAWFEDVFDRYLPPSGSEQSETSATVSVSSELQGPLAATTWQRLTPRICTR